MENIKHQSLAQIVRDNIHTVHVFEEYGLDFCCNGHKLLEEICIENKLDMDTVIEKLNDVRPDQIGTDINLNALDVDELCDYIVNKHHSYVKQNLPVIHSHLLKTKTKHAENHSELNEVMKLFSEIHKTIEPHMRKEEFILFPYIRNLSESAKSKSVITTHTPLITNPINVLQKEHNFFVEYMRDIRALTNDLTPPIEACTTFKLVYAELDAFEKDLHIHMHLENNVLFPKVILMEKELIDQKDS